MIISPYELAAVGGGLNPLWSNVILALHGDGTDGSTTIVDDKNGYVPSNVTPSFYQGGVEISTAESKFGGASIKFPGSGGLNYAAGGIDPNFEWPGDFCFRAWVYWDGTTGDLCIIDTRDSAGSTVGFVFYVDTTGFLNLYSGVTFQYTATSTFPDNVWVHLAVVRAGPTMAIWQDGALAGSFTNGTDFSSGRCAIGDVNNSYSNPPAPWSGYMDDIEVINGEAVYTAAFTPPTAPFPDF